MADEVTIRNGRLEDSKTLQTYINSDSMLEGYEGELPTSLESIEKTLSSPDSELVLVAEKEGQVAGFVMGYVYPEDKRAYCSFLYVAPQHRRNGIARKLFESFQEGVSRRGCVSMTGLVNHSNINIQVMLAKLGWKEGNDFKCFYKELGEQKRH